jgi:pimeloyl-ACP methyl ester carboxylesterase
MIAEQTISIVAIHGNGGGGFRFDIAKPLFPSNIDFLNPSLPGFNCTDIPQSNYSMKQYADWMANYLKDVEPPRILMGHGLGGVFVLEFLQNHSDMVSGVILHSIVGANLNKRIFPKVMKLPYVAWLTKNVIAHPITRPIISRKFFQRKIDAVYEKKFFEAFGKCDAFEQMFNLIDYSWFKNLSPVNVPAAFLWGGNDWILKTNEIEAFQKIFPFNYKDIVPSWDHFPMIDRPESYALKVSELANQLLEHSNVFK